MTPKERVINRLNSKKVDKIPNFNIVMLFAARYANIPYGVFCSDYKALVEAQTKTAIDFGIDILSTMSDPFRETYDFGGPVRFVEDDLPLCNGPTFKTLENWTVLKKWNPYNSTRMLDRINAIKLFKKNNVGDYPILGWIEGPLAEFCDLTTVSEGMMMLYEDEEILKDVLDFITAQEIDCALAQIESGADIIGIGDAVASLINIDMYKNFVFPRERQIVEAIKKAGALSKLHICGNINHILPDIIKTGADIVDIDYIVDFENAMELGKDKCCICGNIEPAGVILRGNIKEIYRNVDFCVTHGNSNSIVASGCEVPRFTPYENIQAINSRLIEIGSV